MGETQVQVRETCPRCEGRCLISEPLWKDFFAWYDSKGGEVTAREQERWWVDRGYSEQPSEEILCPDCEGSGWVHKWVAVSEVLVARTT